jgi:hypothetical protein
VNPNKRPLSVTILGCIYIGVGSVGFVYHLREILARHAFHYDNLLVELAVSETAPGTSHLLLRQSSDVTDG